MSPHASSRFPDEGQDFESYFVLKSLLFGMSSASVICLKVVKKGGWLRQRNRAGKLADRMLHAVSYH